MNKMKTTLIGLLLLIPVCLFAQNVDFKKQNFPNDPDGFTKAMTSLSKGQDYFFRGPRYYERSLKFLLEANAFNPNNADLNFQIGTVYNALNLKGEAAEYFKKAALLNPKFRKEGQLLTAENYHLDMQWDKAISEYRDYIEILNQESVTAKKAKKAEIDAEIAQVNQRIAQCGNGKILTKDTVDIILINLGKGVNSKYPDYSPIISADEKNLYFTSRRPNTTGGEIPPGDVYYYEDIYHSTKEADGRWSAAKQVKGFINTKDHEGTVALSPDGKKMIIYRFKNNGDLFESKLLEDGSWSLPKSLDKINSKYRETHASYSPDGKSLYFTSNNPDLGAKGLDIFKINYDEATGNWGTPERLPETVNTDFDEDGVFVDAEGKMLYFSSKGHNSIGGYDIFKSELVNGVPSQAVNMGYPINNPADDVFFVVMPGGKRAYFDSGRKGGFGEKDIYTMLFLSDLKLELVGTIFDKETNGKISNASIEIVKDNKKVDLTYPSAGDYTGTVKATQRYKATVKADGYADLVEYFTAEMVHPDSFTIRKDFYMTPQKFLLVRGKVYDELTDEVIPANIEFAAVLGEEKITTKSGADGYREKLDRLGVYKAKVTAQGYQSYEDIVSLNEAGVEGNELEKDFYLLKNGAKGIVRDIAVSGNIIEKATRKAQNGKITIRDEKNKVVAVVNSTVGQGYKVNLKTNTVYSFNIDAEGFDDIAERVVLKASKNSNEVKKNFYVEKTTENILAIKSIYFYFDKFNIRQDALADLNNVVKVMNQYPEAKVDISGHTDSRGSYEYNLTLSLNRAKAAYNWLIANGVSKDRITFSNYSFSKPAAPNENPDGTDNPEGRQKNRRVEFKVYTKTFSLESEGR